MTKHIDNCLYFNGDMVESKEIVSKENLEDVFIKSLSRSWSILL